MPGNGKNRSGAGKAPVLFEELGVMLCGKSGEQSKGAIRVGGRWDWSLPSFRHSEGTGDPSKGFKQETRHQICVLGREVEQNGLEQGKCCQKRGNEMEVIQE